MIGTHFARHLLLGAVSAAFLAGCSAGSQFTPSYGSAGTQNPALHHNAGGQRVSPDTLLYNYILEVNGKYEWFYEARGYWEHGFFGGVTDGHTVGGSSTQTKLVNLATADATVDVYSNKKLVTTLTGLNGVACGVGTDSNGDTFAAVNVSGTAVVEEFAEGATTPTATYTDPNLSSIASLAIDKTNRVYVEGQSQAGRIEVDEMAGSGSFAALAPGGTLGVTAGGLAVQISGKTTYVWINDLGSSNDPANIARYEFDGKSLVEQGVFEYSGVNNGIAVDPRGKDTTDVYAANSVASGSQYTVSGVEYAFPSGQIVSQSPAQTESQESFGIWVK